jgi:hypothetical protein
MTSVNTIATVTLDTTVAFLLFLSKSDIRLQFLCALVINEQTYRRHRPRCGVKNTFGVSVYSEEYTFTSYRILFTSKLFMFNTGIFFALSLTSYVNDDFIFV